MADNADGTSLLLERAVSVPPVFTRTSMKTLAETPLLSPSTTFPMPEFARAITSKDGTNLPQSIAHRGYKALFPENTMAAFVGAVKVGAHALETDIHLTKDGVVVLSHDGNLKRCFGKPDKIIDCDWEYLSTLRTLKEPREPMPRLIDLLQYLAEPGLEELWVLLDIKLDNDADDVMRLIAETISKVPSRNRAWKDRILLGCWATKFLPLCDEHLPNYPISHIGFSTTYARQFFTVPNIASNMLIQIMIGPIGGAYIRDAKALNRPVFAWTVNDKNKMQRCIRKGFDGVFTDDPKKFLQVCETWQKDKKQEGFTVKEWIDIIRIHIFALVYSIMFARKFGWGVDKRFIQRATTERR